MKKTIQNSQNIYDFFVKFVSIPRRGLFFEKYRLNLYNFVEDMDSMSKEVEKIKKEKNISDDLLTRSYIIKILSLSQARFGKNDSYKDFLWTFFNWEYENSEHINVVKQAFKTYGFCITEFLVDHYEEFKKKNTVPYSQELNYQKVIGRDSEIKDIILSLKRLKKNNPVLVGEAGVGKTAVVEKLNYLVVRKEVPDFLKGYKIFSLNLLEIASGAKFKGEIEKRFKEVIDFIRNKKIILFIDEIHSLRSFDDTNLLNYLKPLLARNDIKIIGATTSHEWESFVKKDEALERRFTQIKIQEPNRDETIKIINNVKDIYEKNHFVKYENNAVENIIDFASKYDRFKANPDKSLDYLDLIGSLAYLEKRKVVTSKFVQSFFKKKFNINSKNIESFLKGKIFQQDEIIDDISVFVKSYEKGINNKKLPIGSFLFVGNSGTGKTFLSEQISDYLGFQFCRIDMSEFKHSSDINKLLGSPPSYVGYNDSSILEKSFRKSQMNVFLFDEIDKAHESVYDVFLQIMDYGKVTLSNGKLLDFRNSIIIFTSNKGVSESSESLGLIKSSIKRNNSKEDLGFAPEFLARLSDVYYFNDLKKDDHFISMKLKEIIKERDLNLDVDKCVIDYIRNNMNKNVGARELNRFFDNYIVKELLKEDKIEELEVIRMDDDKIIFR